MSVDKELQLQRISKLISIDDNREVYTRYYDLARKFIMDKLCEDPFFNFLYCGTELMGSYADDVKINDPDEFDLNVSFNLAKFGPFKITKSNLPSAARVCVADWLSRNRYQTFYQNLKNLTDDYGYIIPTKMNKWFQGVISRQGLNIPRSYWIAGENFNLSFSTFGFAQTFKVTVGSRSFAIDLAPSFNVLCNQAWISDRKPVNFGEKEIYWNVAPKPFREDERAFKTSFTKMETFIMEDKQQLKNVFRLVKKLVTKNQLEFKSYYIKTVFLWLNEEKNKSFWERSIHAILTDVLDELINVFAAGRLLCYWDKSENFIGKMEQAKRQNYMTVLRTERTKLMSGVNIPSIFLNKQEHEANRHLF